MGPRIVLHTGKGGVGKTSVAAATARRAAASGARTLVFSTDPAHSLADVLDVEIGDKPVQAGDRLWAEQVQAQAEIERNWASVRDWLSAQLLRRGADRISAEEITVPPGLDELFALLRLRRHADGDEFDVVVVDCAPTGETLRLLSLPDVARWWLDRVVPAHERGALDAARPFSRAVLDVALPDDDAIADVTGVVRGVLAMGDVLRDAERVSVRLVMTPERLAVDEARRTFTYLNLYGFPVDAVLVNRVFPAEVGDYFDGWRERQEEELRDVVAAFAPVPVLRAPYFAEEVRGPEMLDRLGDEAFGDLDPAAILHRGAAERLELSEDAARLHLPLPLAQRGDVSLRQVGSELVVRVDGYKRTLMLPPALQGWSARGAELADGALTVELERPIP
jgi:arsenite/tail-anchored protein-transporting ATPase